MSLSCFLPLVCQYRKGEGIAEAWTGHALISRQKEINFTSCTETGKDETKLQYNKVRFKSLSGTF